MKKEYEVIHCQGDKYLLSKEGIWYKFYGESIPPIEVIDQEYFNKVVHNKLFHEYPRVIRTMWV